MQQSNAHLPSAGGIIGALIHRLLQAIGVIFFSAEKLTHLNSTVFYSEEKKTGVEGGI
jgi:hypothetical protein